jgi:hypothetical protein
VLRAVLPPACAILYIYIYIYVSPLSMLLSPHSQRSVLLVCSLFCYLYLPCFVQHVESITKHTLVAFSRAVRNDSVGVD